MTLDVYRKKRDFEKTTEPLGSETLPEGSLRFVVQKHKATRLHFDLRLELEGALKSWAVPKGPSLNPADKRLAVHVEDHPMEYRTFEGVIPKGNYGAGTVMVWDEGGYCAASTCDRMEAEETLREQLEKGHLSLVLNGKKLNGRFALTRLNRSSEENAWLLIKADDEYASAEQIREQDRSVISGRTMEQIADEASATGEIWFPAKVLEELDLSDAPEEEMPRCVSPMLAMPTDKAVDKPGWLFEVKWDGYRALAEVQRGDVRLYSRSGRSFNAKFPTIVESLSRLGVETVLDGEIVVVDETGVPRFHLIQSYLRTRRGALVYYVFDVIHVEGHDLRGLPLRRRKEILRQILPDLANIKFSDYLEERGRDLFRLASEQGLEGIVGKRAGSPYQPGVRSRDWLKVRIRLSEEFVIGGYTEPRGGRSHFGALVLGVYEGDDLFYVGHAGSGLDEKELTSIMSKLRPLERNDSPFIDPPKGNMPIHWVEPELVCQVDFHGWTEEGLMRQPVILGLREDKPAREVQRRNAPTERPRGKFADRPHPKSDKQVIIGAHTVKLTNPDKIFWSEEGYTKGDLISFYRDISSVILPYLHNRPESLHRHPDGITGESFYHKDIGDLVPDWIETVRISSDDGGEYIDYMLCQNEAALAYMANLGCIEINPWNSRVQAPGHPDYLVIDLDPVEVPFDTVVEAALVVNEILELGGITGYCKTSGAKGLHIYVPTGAKYTYDQVRQFGRVIAELVHERLPDTTSLERSPAKRQKMVYLDVLQNRRGQTVASAYSVRPQPGATVSTPLAWEEVRPGLDPRAFTIRTTARRLEQVGDIFSPVIGHGVDLSAALNKLFAAL